MEFPITTAGLTVLVAEPPAQRVDFETKVPKVSKEGLAVFSVRVLVMNGTESTPLRLTVHGDPQVAAMQPVRLHGLTVNTMERKGETISWWTAMRLEPLGPPLASAEGSESAAGAARGGRKADT